MANGIVNVTKPFCYMSENNKNANIIVSNINAMYGPIIVATSESFNVYSVSGSNLNRLFVTTEQPTITIDNTVIKISASSRYIHWLIILGGSLQRYSYVTFNND